MKLFLVLFMLLSSTSALADIAPGWFKHKDTITKASIAAEVDAGMLASFAAMESSFRHEVKHNDTSAKGLFQFTVPTWKATTRQYGKQYGITERTSRSDPSGTYMRYFLDLHFTLRRNAGILPSEEKLILSMRQVALP